MKTTEKCSKAQILKGKLGKMGTHISQKETRLAQGQPFHADIHWEGGTIPARACPHAEVSEKPTPIWLYHLNSVL